MSSFIPMGVDAATGELLSESVPGSVLDTVDEDAQAIQGRNDRHLGAAIDDANDLSQAGWCMVFPAGQDSSAVKAALKPLLDLRAGEAGPLFQVMDGDRGYQPGDTAERWLRRRGLDLRMVDPTAGVPYYVVLAGSAEQIPFEFQYKLDSYWAVGRLYFDSPEGWAQYAAKAAAAEQTKSPKTAAIVATRHPNDPATQLFHDNMALPLLNGTDAQHPPLGSNRGFAVQGLLADDAKKQNILDLIAGKRPGGRPSLLFSGSHGMRFDMTDPEQAAKQGALLCADFKAGAPVPPTSFLCERDLGGISCDGMIHFFFACYSAGCPAMDTYDRMPDGSEKALMPKPVVARLPQGLLSRGALAVIGHVDRAWASSFKGAGRPQIQEFRFTLDQILKGVRVGQATDQFNQRWSVLSASLSDLLRNRQFAGQVSDDDLGDAWKARNDARNYVVLGDPAVRLSV